MRCIIRTLHCTLHITHYKIHSAVFRTAEEIGCVVASLCLQCRHQDAHTLSRARLKQNKITTNIRSYTLPPYKDVSIQITPIHTILKINIGIRGSNQKWFHVVISRHRWTRNERRLEDIAIFPKGFGIFTKMLRTKNSACWETSKNT